MIGIRECQHVPFLSTSVSSFYLVIDLKTVRVQVRSVRASLCVCASAPSFLASTFQLMVIIVIDRWLMGRNGRDTGGVGPHHPPTHPRSASIRNLFMCVFLDIYKVIAFLARRRLIDWIFGRDTGFI